MAQNDRIRYMMLDGPCSSYDVSTELGISTARATSALIGLEAMGHVTRLKEWTLPNPMTKGGRRLYLYELTPAGMVLARKRRKLEENDGEDTWSETPTEGVALSTSGNIR
jgi:predicted transcriptional regulator